MSVRKHFSSPCRGEVAAKRRVGGSRRTQRNRNLIGLARHMRRNMTAVEAKLWSRLRQSQMEGYAFRRQHPIGNYIADFWCGPLKLVIELDGGQHAKPENRAKDEDRTRFLNGRNIRVLRFWNSDVMDNFNGVLATIRQTVLDLKLPKQPPTLTLPPVGGRKLREVER